MLELRRKMMEEDSGSSITYNLTEPFYVKPLEEIPSNYRKYFNINVCFAFVDNDEIRNIYNSLEYSRDGTSWRRVIDVTGYDAYVDIMSNDNLFLYIRLFNNEKVYVRAKAAYWNYRESAIEWARAAFTFNVKCEIGGNIMSLIHGDEFVEKSNVLNHKSNFALIFNNWQRGTDKLMSAKNLILPVKNLTNDCYRQMFVDNNNLKEGPIILAETVGEDSCKSMFEGCPIESVVASFRDISANRALDNWMNNVSPTGIFYNLGKIAYPEGVSGIPSGWAIKTKL